MVIICSKARPVDGGGAPQSTGLPFPSTLQGATGGTGQAKARGATATTHEYVRA